MENYLVSVIIPAYNTAEYIGGMLDSVSRQTYSNMEVIVINDGSTDNTQEVIAENVGKFKNIRIFTIPNGGVSNARNLGIEKSEGKKIFFWDSDDIMEPETIEQCVRFGEDHHVRAVLYGYANYVNGKKGLPASHELETEYRGKEIIEKLLPHFIGHSFDDVNRWIKGEKGMRQGKEHTALWRIMLDADTIKKNDLRFDSRLTLGEDTRFISEYMLYETSIGFLNRCLYFLTMRETGANLTSVNNAVKRLNDKVKLIQARKEVDKKAMLLHGVDIHEYWEGTLVFSAVELAIRMSTNTRLGLSENYRLYKSYLSDKDVRMAVEQFCPAKGLKSVPFRMLRLRMENILYWGIYVMPRFVVSKLSRSAY